MDAIEKTLELEASPERVWRAMTDAAELARWFPDDGAQLEAFPGGCGWLSWEAHGRFALEVVVFEPPRRLAWRWSHQPDRPVGDGPSTLVEWTLTPREGGGTLLELRESGFLTEKHRQENTGGWEHELGELVDYLGRAA